MAEREPFLLEPEEVAALTGHPYPAHQIRWLREKRWAFEVGGDGRPKVLRSYAYRQLGIEETETARPRPQVKKA